MEELYRSIIPDATIHSIDWSSLNLLAVSSSITKAGFVGEGFGSLKTHQLLVFDANRPWQYYSVYNDNKSITCEVKWSQDGLRLLSVEQDGVARVWKMKERCVNSWIRSHRVKLHDDKLLHISWIEYQPLPNVNCNKEGWSELLEYHSYSSRLHMVIPESAVFVYITGLIQVVSFNGVEPVQNELQLDVDGNLCASRTQAAADGTLLCVAVCGDGVVKLFVISVTFGSNGSGFTMTSSLATSFHPTGGGGGQLTDLVMHPDTRGCLLHICYDNTNLLQWSLKKDIQSGIYTANRECLYITPQPVTYIDCTALCLKGNGSSPANIVTTPATGTEFILDHVSGAGDNRDKCWPVELIVMVHSDNTTTVLNKNSYQELYSGKLKEDINMEPTSKRSRMETDGNSNVLLRLSPNGCCAAFASIDTISVHTLCPFILGEKGFESPDISRWGVLLTMAATRDVNVWDIATMCSRVSYKQKDPSLVIKILERWMEDFVKNSGNWQQFLLPICQKICQLMHCSHEHGLTLSLDHRDIIRLHATFSIFQMALPTSSKLDIPLINIINECSESPEDNLDNIIRSLQLKDFEITKELAGQLQSHSHWIIGFAVKVASRVATLAVNRYPHRMSLKVLKQCILLIYIWNKCLPTPLLAINDSAMSLLFKVVTCPVNNEITSLDDAVKAEVSRNFPSEERNSILTLTKAAHLQGFIHGLSKTEDLPETFHRDRPPPLRPHVQAHYMAYEPFSFLGLVVPNGLVPPWKDMFVEGQVDVIHGGYLTNAVVQDAKLRQCSRCWTVLSTDSSSSEEVLSYSSPIQQWRHNWSENCLCGSLWINSQS